MKWWCFGTTAAAPGDDELRHWRREAKRCKRERRLLRRDLRQVWRLHRRHAHLPDDGQGQALEIDLQTQLRAADVRIAECRTRIADIKQRRLQGSAAFGVTRDASPRDFSGSGDEDVRVARARVVQELQTLFGSGGPGKSSRVTARRIYVEPFKYM